MRRKLFVVGLVVVVLAVVGFAGWWFVIRDDPPAAVQGVEEQFGNPSATTLATSANTTAGRTDATTASSSATTSAPTADGTWTIRRGPDGFAGYRIDEQYVVSALASTVVGRSHSVDGTIELVGSTVSAARVDVDMTRINSRDNQRDNRMRTGGIETDTFPTATFVLTAAIDLGAVPTVGQVFTVTAAGDLTLHGVTQSISLPLEARWTGDTVDVTGSTPIVLADYGISMEAFAGTVKVAPEGTIELALQFVRA